MGGFLLIDPETFDTVALGLVQAERAGKRARRPGDSNVRSLLKAISWRTLGTLDTVIMALVFTGSLGTSLAIGGAEMLTKTVLYYTPTRRKSGKSPCESPAGRLSSLP